MPKRSKTPTTFLAFVCDKLLGANKGSGYKCPRCNAVEMHLLPNDRFQCRGCDAQGGLLDLLQYYGVKPNAKRVEAMEQLRAEYHDEHVELAAAAGELTAVERRALVRAIAVAEANNAALTELAAMCGAAG